MMKAKIESWSAVYKRTKPFSQTVELVALFRDQVDADEWHANPDLYFNCRRNLKMQPAPIELLPGARGQEALVILIGLISGKDEALPSWLERGRELLESIEKSTS